MRTNLLPFKDVYETDDEGKIVYVDKKPKLKSTTMNSALFGDIANYDKENGKIDFSGDVYRFKNDIQS
jgi:hypothetical protein